jgi:hypothetical protein
MNKPLSVVQNNFGAVDILPCIITYLQKLGLPIPHRIENHNLEFSLFKRMYVWIPPCPQVSQYPTKDTIIATCPITPSGCGNQTTPGQFSTAIIRVSEPESSDPLDGAASVFQHLAMFADAFR